MNTFEVRWRRAVHQPWSGPHTFITKEAAFKEARCLSREMPDATVEVVEVLRTVVGRWPADKKVSKEGKRGQ